MKLYHTSPKKIEKINKNGLFDDALCFSTKPYTMHSGNVYTYSIIINDDDEFLDIRVLWYDHEPSEVQDIIDHVKAYGDLDDETAIEVLDGSLSQYDVDIQDPGDFGWFIQARQAEISRRLGYLGSMSEDEQGTVYLIPMLGLEDRLMLEDIQREGDEL